MILEDFFNVDDSVFDEPTEEKLLNDIGVMSIVDSIHINVIYDKIEINIEKSLWQLLIFEQREQIINCLVNSLAKYKNCSSNYVRDFIIKQDIFHSITSLANSEEEPGIF